MLFRLSVLVAIALLFCTLWRRAPRPPTHVVPLRTAIRLAKTGDLILFRWHTRSPFESAVSAYSHVGVVAGGKLIEAHAEGDASRLGNDRGGVFAYDIEQRLRAYEGDVALVRLHRRLSETDRTRLERAIAALSDHPFDHDHRRWYVGACLLGAKPLVARGDGLFCSEFVARAFLEAGLVHDIDPACQTPDDVTRWGLHDLPIHIER